MIAPGATIIPACRPPRVMHSVGFWELAQAGRQLYEQLWVATGFGSRPVVITDWELAKLCGRGLRWVQKALEQLQNRTRGENPDPIISRFRVYGRKSESGRAIQIIDPLALPDPKPEPKPKATAPPKPAAAQKPAPGDNGVVHRRATAEEVAAAAAARTATEAQLEQPPTAEAMAAWEAYQVEFRARKEAEARSKQRASQVPTAPRPVDSS